MALVTVTFVQRQKECWPSWGSNLQPNERTALATID